MSDRKPFSKTIGGDFDRIDLSALGDPGNEWLKLTMHVGRYGDETVVLTLRGDEAVRDLHYALGRYIAQLPTT